MTDLQNPLRNPDPLRNPLRTGAAAGEKLYWRSLEQLADDSRFQEILHREFPEKAAEFSPLDDGSLTDPVSRRRFLGVVAASVAVAGMASCRKPQREILPFTNRPEGLVPGMPRYYATAFERHGYGLGMLVRSNDGRPTKVEGNPEHPATRGASDSFAQAEVLNLFDPGRSQRVLTGAELGHAGAAADDGHASGHADPHAAPAAPRTTLADFSAFWREHALELAGREGEGLHLLLAPSASPTLQRMIAEALVALPKARFHVWSPIGRERELAATKLAFGAPQDAQFDFSKAAVIASFDSDFLGADAPTLAWSRNWAEGRKILDRQGSVSRLYVTEPSHTLTGSNADHRFRLSGAEVSDALIALAAALGVGGGALRTAGRERKFTTQGGQDWIDALAKDLRANPGKACVIVGPRQPAAIQALGCAINAALDAVGDGKPVAYTPTPAGIGDGSSEVLKELAAAMTAGSVDTLVCLGTNPVYDAPADLGFAAAYAKVPHRIHSGLWLDETAQVSTWHVPATHPLEEWGDTLAFDGTPAIVQPLIAPLYPDARSTIEMLAELWTEPRPGDELVQATWQNRAGGGGFDAFWKRALHDGVAGPAPQASSPTPDVAAITAALAQHSSAAPPSIRAIEVGFRACPTLLDGRYSNNPWQQELPTPIEKLVWDNAVLMSRATAKELGVYNRDLVRVSSGGRSVVGPVWIQAGHADHCVTLWLGYGRRLPELCGVADGAGFDVNPLRTSESPWYLGGATIEREAGTVLLVSSQEHGVMEGRPLVRERELGDFKASDWEAVHESPLAKAARLKGKTEADLMNSLWVERDYSTGYQWGMVIDLNSCTGCGACVTACVSENNIPMVGKVQISHGREMFWNRIDRYFEGTATQDGVANESEPRAVHQMVPCMQCENAPCESVCPVAATTHSPEGLNDMAYNRCIGTRYCSNNCPYKVRRFNWFNFNKDHPPQRQMAFNPDVTVRSRGVMEKCTYCVQRINAGKLRAKLDGRHVRDGEIETACQQACPTEAIAFGNILDHDAVVSKQKSSVLNYGLLSELNTKPRTTYLAKIRNTNSELS